MDDSETRVADLKDMVKKFSAERDWDQFHNAKDLAVGIVTEASELLEMFRFKSEREVESILKDPKKAREVQDELADVFYFALRLAQKYGIDVSTALRKKIDENARKYPVRRSKGSNKKYTELEP